MLERKGQGRPKKDPKEVRNKVVSFKTTSENYERIRENAKLKGLSIADYVISLVNMSEMEDEYGDDVW